MLTVEYLKENNLILFECLSGSHLFGTNREDSDMDYRGIFILPKEYLYTNQYIPQINDEKGDTTYYELSRFIELLLENKPNMIEMLYAPDDKVIYKDNSLDFIFNNKNSFIGENFAKATIGFAESQIRKAKGLNKKLNWEADDIKRKTVLDFCFVPYKQGSANIQNWLEHRGLKQDYCGLVNLNNMRDVKGVYYDFWQHVQFENLNLLEALKLGLKMKLNYKGFKLSIYNVIKEYRRRKFSYKNFKYKGIVQDRESSNDVSLCEVPKGETPITIMQFNKDGYSMHCRRYKEYQEYIKNRNQSRYNDIKGHDQKIDGKNLLHMIRSLKMCLEYYQSGNMNIDRTHIDREYLLSIRKGEMDLETIITYGYDLIEDIKNQTKNQKNNTLKTNQLYENIIKVREKFIK